MNKLVILAMVFVIAFCLATSLYEAGVDSLEVLPLIVLLTLAFFFGPIAAMYLFFMLLSKVVRR